MLKLGTTGVSTTYSKAYLGNILVYDGYAGIKTTPNSNNYILNNSAEGKNKGNIKIGDGLELAQVTTEGKNMFDGEIEQGSFSGSTGKPIASDTRVRSKNFTTLLTGGDYTISVKNNSLFDVVIYVYNENEEWISDESATTWQSLPFTKTFLQNRKLKFAIKKKGATSNIVPSEVSQPQLEPGATATDYEPYSGGYASPNPDYPQDITVIEGSSSIGISNKNLFNPTIAIEEQVNVDNIIQTSNLYTINNNSILCSRNTFNLGRLFFKGIKCKVGTYYIKAHVKITNSSYNDISYSIRNLNTMTDILRLQTATYETGEGDLAFSFTINEDVNEVGLSLQTNHTGTIEITKLMFSMSNDNYISYQGQTYPITLPTGMFLGSIGTSSNYIYGTKNNWKLYSRLLKLVLDGSEAWSSATTPGGIRFYFNDNNIATSNSTGGVQVISNLLPKIDAGVSWNNDVTGISINRDTHTLLVKFKSTDYDIDTIAKFKTWLGTHNLTAYTVRTTPTETPITDTTLISQLNNIIDNLQTYKGGTVVFTSGETLAPNIQFDYRAK